MIDNMLKICSVAILMCGECAFTMNKNPRDISFNITEQDKKKFFRYISNVAKNKQNIDDRLRNKNYINLQDTKGCTPLFYAINEQNNEFAKYLIQNGADINHQDIEGFTPLMFAIRRKQKELISLLLENGADIQIRKKNLQTPTLVYAVEQGNYEIVQMLVQKQRNTFKKEDSNLFNEKWLEFINAKRSDDNNSLSAALELANSTKNDCYEAIKSQNLALSTNLRKVLKERYDIIDYLIDQEADIANALIRAAVYGTINSFEYLAKKGFNINMCDEFKNTPLSVASVTGNLKLVQYLTNPDSYLNNTKNTDNMILNFINHKNIDGMTALICASVHKQRDVVEYLLSKNANIKDKNVDGWNALIYAAHNNDLEMVKYLINKDKSLIEEADNNKNTPLLHATDKNNTDVAKYLIQQHANVNAQNQNGTYPIFLSVAHDNLDLVKYLVQHNANTDAIIREKYDLLHIAIMYKNPKIVDYLLDDVKIVEHKNNISSYFQLTHQLLEEAKTLEDRVSQNALKKIIGSLEKKSQSLGLENNKTNESFNADIKDINDFMIEMTPYFMINKAFQKNFKNKQIFQDEHITDIINHLESNHHLILKSKSKVSSKDTFLNDVNLSEFLKLSDQIKNLNISEESSSDTNTEEQKLLTKYSDLYEKIQKAGISDKKIAESVAEWGIQNKGTTKIIGNDFLINHQREHITAMLATSKEIKESITKALDAEIRINNNGEYSLDIKLPKKFQSYYQKTDKSKKVIQVSSSDLLRIIFRFSKGKIEKIISAYPVVNIDSGFQN